MAKRPSGHPATAAPTPKPPTLITSNSGMTFDEKSRVAIYNGAVEVVDPQFTLNCDKLTAYLKKAAPEGKGAPSAVPTPEASAAEPGKKAGKHAGKEGGGNSGANSLDHAVAEGNVLITQDKTDEKGEATHSIGKGAKANYDAATGDITLTGWPQMQQGQNNQVATDEKTVMILNRDGHLRTLGRSKTEIINQSDLKKGDPAKSSTVGAANSKPGKSQ